jgi:hypothetical protein
MSRYKFDGKTLKLGGTTIANVSGNNIRKGTGAPLKEILETIRFVKVQVLL